MKNNRQLVAVGLLLASSALMTPAALAHESRVLPASTGSIRVTVGFLGEPAFEDTYNGLDLFLFTFDSRCSIDQTDFFGNPITSAEIKSVSAEALYFNQPAPPTGTLGSKPPTGATILKKLLISANSPISGVFGDPGHYHSWFRPTHPGGAAQETAAAATLQPSGKPNKSSPGAYGYHVWGEVSTKETTYTCDADSENPVTKTIPARTAKFDTYWVCTAGFRDPNNSEARGQFSCIQPVQSFPGDPQDGYEPNKPFSTRGSGS